MSPSFRIKKGKRGRKRRGGKPKAKRIEVGLDELRAIIERTKDKPLSTIEREQLVAAVETLAFITQELEESEVTIARLRQLIFGSTSEKTADVLAYLDGEPEPEDSGEETAPDDTDEPGDDDVEVTEPEKKKKKGHGRNGADAYTGATKVTCPHDTLQHGDPCPECLKGKVYRMKEPIKIVRIQGVSPLDATVYEVERLRCNLCGEIFKAKAPPDVGNKKYDATAAAMIALLKYGTGLPFNRLERLGHNLGIPLPAATQWDVVAKAAEAFEPIWSELIARAAGGEVLHIDDTNMPVLSLLQQIEEEQAAGEGDRTGVFTSGVVSKVDGRQLAIFFTGREHAGENLDKVLAHRDEDLLPPIQMADALSRNTSPGAFETIVAKCNVHLRRKFIDVGSGFPDEVKRVLETFGAVYRFEAEAKQAEMTPEERLAYHQEHSKPLMDDLKEWLLGLVESKEVEDNSGLGRAIAYMKRHWDGLSQFTTTAGAPIDNNDVERTLKRAILHRKNSLFFKTERGAHVGDVYLSLIQTAELCGANPFDYLVAVIRHADHVEGDTERWMPWNYTYALAGLEHAPAASID